MYNSIIMDVVWIVMELETIGLELRKPIKL